MALCNLLTAGVESDVVIEHQDRSVQSDPLTVREIHRILLEN